MGADIVRRWVLVNFVVLAVLGFLLRYMQLYGLSGFSYPFLLHGHSHFAFAWMFLALALFFSDLFDEERRVAAFKGIFTLTQISAYGMLGSFSFQGYKAVAIIFSTLFILLTYWFAYRLLTNERFEDKLPPLARKLVFGAVFCLCLSSLGPFTLAPIIVTGLKGTVIYQNAIYFYLHFQMNGWMLFAALGLFAARYLKRAAYTNDINRWLDIFIWSAVPLYFIFILWADSGWWFNVIAFTGAVMHLLSWIKVCHYFKKEVKDLSMLVKASLFAITLKAVFQVLVCFPGIGDWVFLNRHLIIGYVHLITLGCVTPLILDRLVHSGYLRATPAVAAVNGLYVSMVVLYLGLLFAQPLLALFGAAIPHFQVWMLWIAGCFVFVGVCYLFEPAKWQTPTKSFFSKPGVGGTRYRAKA